MKKVTNFENEYKEFLKNLKTKVKSSQLRAFIKVNKELLNLYWDIGKSLDYNIKNNKWGSSVVDRLSRDLKKEFPDMKGFSRTNLFSMKSWYKFYENSNEKVQQLVGQIPWGHNITIINKIKDSKIALFYVNQTIKNGWSRNVLIHQI